ncbi:zinc ribbon domain-containing protein [Ruminococcus bicirculans]|uniref:Zinc ribbon domain-containing protein n=1 Tax=Ruminococcus bicirculans (ex Wegman et al. 2014) TaxID=1160721 RepID=A0AAW6E2F0_9FIRM|nr:zinc ribbon domain-containing protein [Ruminococcus bicirculans (ex Wegman et al. 2014)]MDB8744099.1 zinc ribbon domain-containing protein [Ruminococcus bicirculans (ex Wegman et al. 2014)]MDB8746965.1 zinc ribbon domain-containing protein [Ruminococcus bicirculans (ex Wegman et al. 2014)]MDB8751678.1 zinc ribbon domain-containing protein [Ruminococcus bicirculans (ex Wegman et al. 2014)]
MECPKCHKSVDDDDIFCPNCDTRLRPDKNTSIMKRFKKQNKPLNVEIVGEKKHKLSENKLKLILITVAVVLLVVLVVLIVVNIISGKGENTAESISEYIGVDVANAQKKLDMHFKDESAFQGVNNALNFDYIIESDDSVNVDGINYPEWAALVTVDDEERIQTVKYSNFKVLKNNANGEKKSKAINLDKFEQGAKWSSLSDAIDLEYYGIVWSKDTKNYIYRYWYENDAGDDQPVVLNVTFDTDNKYLYYSSTLIYPEYL